MRLRKKYLYFPLLALIFTVVFDIRFVFAQKPSFEIAPSSGPTIQNTVVSPASGFFGTIYTITTRASDVSGIGSVIAHIQNPDETDVALVTLYDDGTHGDGVANDGTYGARWNSTGFPGAKYYVDIVANDLLGYFSEAENGASFNIIADFPPIADARVGRALNPTEKRIISVTAGDIVYFDGSTYSSDPDGTITKYEWDFEDNGTYDWSSSITGATTHLYPAGSGYVARLRVTDDYGAIATDTVNIDRVFSCTCEVWASGSCSGGIFGDDFESYNLGTLSGQGNWSGDSIFQVVNTLAQGGTKSGYSQAYNTFYSISKFETKKQSGIQSIYINFSDTRTGPVNEILLYLRNDAVKGGSFLNTYGFKYNNSTSKWGFIYQQGSNPYNLIVLVDDVSKQTWHSIQVEFNEPNWKYRLKLDNGNWSSWLDFFDYLDPRLSNEVEGFRILTYGAETWFDTIGAELTPSCLANQKSRTRTCKPSGCATEFDCDGNAATCGGFFPPSSFDWSHKVLPSASPAGGADWMSPVKNQGTWDASTLFASTGVMEGKYNIQKNNPNLDIDLSEQYMDACLQTSLLQDIQKDTGGPADEACFPYQAHAVSCSLRCSNWNTRLWDLTGVNITGGNAAEIKYLLINKGPLRVTMDMAHWNPITYSCGPGASVNHAAVIVGYDDAEGVWIVRNSWGSSWNGNGYFKVKYGECLIEDEVVAIDGLISP